MQKIILIFLIVFLVVPCTIFSQINFSKKLDLTEFKFLKEKIKGKNIVCLGEFNHGYESISEVKSAIIEFLVKEEGFSVIIFENPMIPLFENTIQQYSPKEWVKHTLYGIWQTKSLVQLKSNISDSINIYGFDIRRGKSNNFYKFIDKYSFISKVFGKEIEKSDSLNQCFFLEYDKNQKPISRAVEIEKTFKKLKDTLLFYKSKINPSSYEYLNACTTSIINHAVFLQNTNSSNANAIRDSLNAINLKWIIKQHPNEKIIIWAANYHVSKKNEYIKCTLQYLDDDIINKTYSVGIYQKYFYSSKEYKKNKNALENNHVFIDYKSKLTLPEHDAAILVSGVKKIKDYTIKTEK